MKMYQNLIQLVNMSFYLIGIYLFVLVIHIIYIYQFHNKLEFLLAKKIENLLFMEIIRRLSQIFLNMYIILECRVFIPVVVLGEKKFYTGEKLVKKISEKDDFFKTPCLK